jgi:hypothetical protein
MKTEVLGEMLAKSKFTPAFLMYGNAKLAALRGGFGQIQTALQISMSELNQ